MKSFWKIVVTVACVAVICGGVITWQLNKAKANERKLAEAARVCRISAEEGDAKAQSSLAYMYSHGEGVPKDNTEAVRWYRKSADQGDARGQNGLGYKYEYGQGVTLDYAEALRWYRKAADQGYAKAQVSLGSMYYYGYGVTQDRAEAARWYRKAADQGYAKTEYDLGRMYDYGEGVTQDQAEAERWYHKAADQGDEYAQRALGLKGPGLSTFRKINYAVMTIGFFLLLIGPRLPVWRLPNRQQRTSALAGILGLSYVALSLFGAYRFSICQPGSAIGAFYFAKNLLAGIAVVLALSLIWPGIAKPRSAKVALVIIGMLFIGFNIFIFAIAHRNLANLAPAIRLVSGIDGHLIGLSLPLAIFLWRSNKKPSGDEGVVSEAAASEIPDESGDESDQA